MASVPTNALLPVERIERVILLVRGEKVILDVDIAALYGVPVKRLNEAVRRNRERFPDDFTFQLKPDEAELLRSQIATSKREGRGGRRYLPFAFTEYGVAMLSGVLHSPRAIQVDIEIMRTFGRLRHLLATHKALAQKLAAIERKFDGQFKVVFEALRQLMEPEPVSPKQKRIGFRKK